MPAVLATSGAVLTEANGSILNSAIQDAITAGSTDGKGYAPNSSVDFTVALPTAILENGTATATTDVSGEVISFSIGSGGSGFTAGQTTQTVTLELGETATSGDVTTDDKRLNYSILAIQAAIAAGSTVGNGYAPSSTVNFTVEMPTANRVAASGVATTDANGVITSVAVGGGGEGYPANSTGVIPWTVASITPGGDAASGTLTTDGNGEVTAFVVVDGGSQFGASQTDIPVNNLPQPGPHSAASGTVTTDS